MNFIAADVGGTKTRFILAEVADADAPQNITYEARYSCRDFDGFESLLETFLQDSGASSQQVSLITIALPGLIDDNTGWLTNLPWVIEKQSLKQRFGFRDVVFMNDFQASAIGIGQLQQEDLITLNTGISYTTDLDDNVIRVAVGAGTGLGVAWLHGKAGSACATACDSEGGHIDFAPADDLQLELLHFLRQSYEHVSYERILSGDGLAMLYAFCNREQASETPEPEKTAEWVNNHSDRDKAASRAVSLFIKIYGAYIGNIAMMFKPRGGIYITGGVAARMVEKMQSEEFINAYLNKGRMQTLVEQIPVNLVTNERIGVLGAMSEAVKTQRVQK